MMIPILPMQIFREMITALFGFGLFVNALLFIPQIMKLHKTKNAQDVSKITFVGFCFMQISAILYGAIHHDMILMAGYGLSLLTCLIATVLIFRYS